MDDKKIFNASADFEQSENGIKILANAGSRMKFATDEVILDMDNLYWDFYTAENNPSLPLLKSHDYNIPIGHANKENVYLADGGLWIDGQLDDCQDAGEILSSLKSGFPYTASIGFNITDCDIIDDGEEVNVNGRTEQGPFILARGILLRECSLCVLGADRKTMVYKAMEQEQEQVNEQVDKEQTIDASAESEQTECVEQVQVDDKLVEAQASLDAKLNEVKEATNKAQIEIERIASLQIVSRKYDNETTLLAEAIDKGYDANQYELNVIKASREQTPIPYKVTENMNSQIFECALLNAAGLPTDKYDVQAQEASAKFNAGSDLRDVFEAATGYTPGLDQRRGDVTGWLYNAASTYNLGSLISNAAQKTIHTLWDALTPNWQKVAKVDSAVDYRKAELYIDDAGFNFEEVPEGGTIPHAEMGEVKAEIQVKDYGKTFALTNQAIRNGEAFGILANTLRHIAIGARNTVNRKFWGLFLNPEQVSYTGEAHDWYSTYHNNVATSKPLNFDNLAAQIAYFATRGRAWGKDKDEIYGNAPKYLVVPSSLEYIARMLVKASTFATGSEGYNPNDYNPLQNSVEVVAEPMLENASLTGYSNSTWYLVADPAIMPAFQINFLDGGAPRVRQSDIAIDKLGIQISADFAFGLAGLDPRSVVRTQAS